MTAALILGALAAVLLLALWPLRRASTTEPPPTPLAVLRGTDGQHMQAANRAVQLAAQPVDPRRTG